MSSAAPKPEAINLKWTVLDTGDELYWLSGQLVSVRATGAPLDGWPRSNIDISIEPVGTAGPLKATKRYRAVLNGVLAGDYTVLSSGTDWSALEFHGFMQVSSTGYVDASSTFDGRKLTPWTYEPAGPGAVGAQPDPDPANVNDSPWCPVNVVGRKQTLSSALSFVVEECGFGFVPQGTQPAILPPETLRDTVSAVAESEKVVWLGVPGTPARVFRWEAGTWKSGKLPKGVGRYSLMLNYLPTHGLVAISDHAVHAKIELEP